MYIPTARLQARVAEHLHDSLCDFTYCTRDFKTCAWARWNRQAIALVNWIMPILISEMFPAVRADEREKIMDRMGRIPSGFLGCPGGHECGCAGEALDLAFRAVEGDPFHRADGVTPS